MSVGVVWCLVGVVYRCTGVPVYWLNIALWSRREARMGNSMSVSFAPECTPAKTKYDECFNAWYSEKFLKGKSLHNECTDLWDEYITCVNTALAKQKIKPMLDKAREDQQFTSEEIQKGK